ncbi:hypothetical protein JCM10207_006510 [Rhodosporidiobolus poonsookiae]
MALVSTSPAPSTSLYPAASPLFAPTDAVRSLPSPPLAPYAHSAPSQKGYMSATAHNGFPHAPGHPRMNGGAQQVGGPSAAGGGNVRPLPSPQPPRARTSSAPHSHSPPYPNANAGSSPSAGTAPLPPPVRVPSRSSSTPPHTSAAPYRPPPQPSPGARSSSSSSLRSGRSASQHSASASSSSVPAVPAIPQLPQAHFAPGQGYAPQHSPSLGGGPNPPFYPSQQASPNHSPRSSSMPLLAHPTFVNQPFAAPFGAGYPNPAYPFMPSPHPSGPAGPYAAYGTPGAGGAGVFAGGQPTPEQQKRMQQYQQQWQLETIKSQQQAMAAQDGQRRRSTSGPQAAHSPTYFTTPLPYPPSPSPSLSGQPHYQFGVPGASMPSLPPGAMLPHIGGHGYPTPPQSVEGRVSGGDSNSSSGGSGSGRAEGGYHPYRRDGGKGGDGARSHRTSPSTSSVLSSGVTARAPTPKQQQPQQQTYAAAAQHARSQSTASVSTLAQSNFPPLPASSSSSLASVRSTPVSTSASSSPVPPSFPRSRTDSQNSSTSSLPSPEQQDSNARPFSALRQRGESFESGRSATPVQGRVRPSPLGGRQDDTDDDGADSDGTAEATATISSGLVASSTMTTISEATEQGRNKAPEPEPQKDKEKKGMKSRFKKAFGVSSSTSSNSLADLEVDGRGPKQVNGGFRARKDSASSSETSTAPRTPPTMPYATHQSHPSMASINSTATLGNDAASTSASRKPPSSRFRLLNPKLNSSTDNISISSTVSSASVMIRKLGQMGKLARRNSLMGLTKAFKKDKSGKDADGAESTFTVGSDAGKLGKKDKKKGAVASASVSHATAEYDTSASPSSSGVPAGMSPAAALARKQQLAYAEQDAAEAARAAEEEAARLAAPLRSFEQLPSHLRQDSADGGSVKSGRWGRSKTAEDADTGRDKEKENLKSRKAGQRWRLGFGGSKTDLRETASINDDAGSTYTSNAGERSGSALGHYEDATPRQSLEVLAPPGSLGYQTYAARDPGQDSQDEYEPSLYRQGAAPRHEAKAVRGILKGAGSYRQEDFAEPRPPFARNRASSFDAPQQHARPGSPGGAALVNVIPSEAQVDGVGPSTTSPRTDTHPPTSSELIADAAIARVHPDSAVGSPPYSNPGLNASAPVLNHCASAPSVRSASAPGGSGRRIAFAANLSVHTTWPAQIYDRRAEPATCNRLTPALAQQIKEELNSFKMEEMDVHPSSRKLTHFFV